jgi:hypothetical protein
MDDFWKFLTVVVAVVVAYIALQQFWLVRERLKLDLFEKRFAVFSAARLFLSKVRQHRGVLMDDFGEYRSSVAEASFLFNEDVVDFLNEIDSRALHLWDLQEERNGRPAGSERESFAARIPPELEWLLSQLSMLNPTFGPYMKFQEWHWIPWRDWSRSWRHWSRSIRRSWREWRGR